MAACKAFISYSHDSSEHEQRVLALAERLRKDGVDAQIDLYVGGTPEEGWPRWMLNRLDWADFVLVICTQTYYDRYRGREEADKGKGADWEGNLITLEIYHAKSRTTKFVPVFFDSQDGQFIPEPLLGQTYYQLNSETNYAKLYAFLTGQAAVPAGELGSLKTLARNPVKPLSFGASELAQDFGAEIFDVFLCHNAEDKSAIREIWQKLAEQGIKPWLDEKETRPETSWQTMLGQQIENIKSAAVFVGESGIGPWQNKEIQGFLSQFVKRKCPVIFAILPSAKTTPDLPFTMANLEWVDFRVKSSDPLKRLIGQITGVKPDEQAQSLNDQTAPQEADVRELLPRKQKLVIEIRLPGKNIDQFSNEERDGILAGIISLAKVSELRLTQAMAGSLRLHLEVKPEDADKIYAATQNGQLAALGISEARLYPTIAVPPEGEERFQLLILLNRVNETWVEGVLRNSLYTEALISLGKRSIAEAVEAPWKHVVEFSSQRSQLLLKDRNITTIFDATGLLLILGEPGSGKTTTLLDLAANLIARGKADAKERVPVVLNLSGWKKREPLADWIAAEMSEKYRVPAKIARSWLQKDYLVPLLDGLDEVATALQPDCVAAINGFIDALEPSAVVVCCRLMEYQWLPKRLKLNGAVCLESLSSEEVNKYLDSGGSKLAALRDAVNTDPVLQELAQTPLMLSIMSLACQGAGGDGLASQKGGSLEERRKQIFGLYVEEMFKRKEMSSLVFPKEKVIGWLSWLARKMMGHSQSVFLVGGLEPNWLDTRGQQRAYETAVALSLVLIFGLPFGLISGRMLGIGEFILVLILGLIAFGLSVGLMRANELSIWWRVFFWFVLASGSARATAGLGDQLGSAVRAGLGLGLILGLFVGPNRRIFAMIQHYALRLVLWRSGATPFKFIKFLDQCARLILLKKVGDGYIFMHRMLLEYFADMAPQSRTSEDGKTGSAGTGHIGLKASVKG